MRRKDREVTKLQEICEILDTCKVLRIAMSVDNVPYIVPLNYGYQHSDQGFVFFFHCAGEGKKLDLLRQNNRVCFEIDCDHQLTAGETACGYGYNYRSVIGMGDVIFVTAPAEKAVCLNRLMKQQTGQDFQVTKTQAAAVTVCKIKVSELTAKQRGYQGF